MLLDEDQVISAEDISTSCDICHTTFFTKLGFKLHYKTEHVPVKNDLLGLEIQPVKLKNTSLLKTFVENHTTQGEKLQTKFTEKAGPGKGYLHRCQYCNKPFTRLANLIVHKTTVHDKLKPYHCQQCNGRFGLKQGLRRHIEAVHEKLGPFICGKCKKSFKHKVSQKHIKTCNIISL